MFFSCLSQIGFFLFVGLCVGFFFSLCVWCFGFGFFSVVVGFVFFFFLRNSTMVLVYILM